MKVGKVFAYSMIMASSLSSCTKKPFVKMPAELVSKEVKTELASYRKEAQEVLKDTSYAFYGKDTLLFDKDFQQRIQQKAKSSVKEVVVGHEMKNEIFFSNNKMHIIPVMKPVKEDKYLEPKAIVNDTTLFTRDSSKVYVPVEYYGKLNPKINSK